MRSVSWFFIFIVFLSGISLPAQAASKLGSFKRVLSYDELMRLPQQRRSAYIKGLRVLFVELENQRPKKSVSLFEQRRLIASLLELYDSSIDRAEAATPATPLGVPIRAGGKTSCSGNFTALKIHGAPQDTRLSNYVCVTNKFVQKTTVDVYQKGCPAGTKQVSAEGPRCSLTQTVMQPQTTPCGSGLIPINQDNEGAYLCATSTSFAKMPLPARHNARMTKYFPLFRRSQFLGRFLGPGLKNYFEQTGPSLSSLTNQIEKEERQDRARAPKWGLWESPIENCPSIGENGEHVDKVPPEYAASVRARCAAYAQGKPLPPLVKVEPPKPKPTATRTPPKSGTTRSVGTTVRQPPAPVKAEAEEWDADSSAAPVAAPVAPAAREAAQGTTDVASQASSRIALTPTELVQSPVVVAPELDSCDPSARATCDAGAIEEARGKYASDSNPDCIYAGAVVGYERGVKQSFKCEPPRSFCFGSTSCRTDAGDAMKPAFTCGTKGVICNPLLFGVKADGKTPFCVSRDANATLACESTAAEEASPVQVLDQDHAGLREAWDDFAERLNQLCQANETSKVLHCEECNVIRVRLFALNAAARNTTTCGAAQKFEQTQCQADGRCTGRPGVKPATGTGGSSGAVSKDDPLEKKTPTSDEVDVTNDRLPASDK